MDYTPCTATHLHAWRYTVSGRFPTHVLMTLVDRSFQVGEKITRKTTKYGRWRTTLTTSMKIMLMMTRRRKKRRGGRRRGPGAGALRCVNCKMGDWYATSHALLNLLGSILCIPRTANDLQMPLSDQYSRCRRYVSQITQTHMV